MKQALVLAMLLGACGEAPVALVATVRFDGLLKDEIQSVSLYAFGPKRSDDIFLTCSTLLNQDMEPTDKRLESLGRVDVAFDDPDGREAVIKDVEAGAGRLVFVQALDGADDVLGLGCEEDVLVEEGKTTTVDVTVYRL